VTDLEIEKHNALCAELTSGDGIPRLTWQQHKAAFDAPAPTSLEPGSQVATWDSATPGTVGALRDGLYNVMFADLPYHTPCRYPASQLRPWPEVA
jgi:hypothetical protein